MLRKQEPHSGRPHSRHQEVTRLRYTAAIEEFLGGKVEITGKVIADVPDQPAIRFRPPGRRPNIAEVHFPGNDCAAGLGADQCWSQVAVGVPYSDATMRQLLDGCDARAI